MSKLQILVVEDEPIIAEHLACHIKDIGYGVAGVAHDYHEAISMLQDREVDFLLLDIKLDGKLSGIDIAKKVKAEFHLPFIFITSFSDRGTLEQAKEVEPLGYLVKPIDEKDLLTTIEIALFNFEKEKNQQPTALPDKLVDTLFIRHNGLYEKVSIADIIRVEARDNYSLIITEHKNYLLSNTLKLVEARLKPWHFMRIHRSHLINPECISHLEDGYIFIDKKALPISRKYKSAVFERLNII